MDRPQSQQVEHHHGPYHCPGKAYVCPWKQQDAVSNGDDQNGRQQHQQDKGNVAQYRRDNDFRVVSQVIIRRRTQYAERIVALQDLLGDHLNDIDEGDHHRQHLYQYPVHLPLEGHGEGAEQAAQG